MKVFICWSGERSKQIAEAFREWLPLCIQAIEAWMSESDLEKGKRWDSEIAGQLRQADFGLVCLTPENQKEPWIHFESGALSKLDKSYLWTFLYDLKAPQVVGPLASFQATHNNREEIGKLLSVINSVAERKLEDRQLESIFDALWPPLEKKLKEIPDYTGAPTRKRELPDMIEEILERVRQIPSQIEKVRRFAPKTASEDHETPRPLYVTMSDQLPVPRDAVLGGSIAPAGFPESAKNTGPIADKVISAKNTGIPVVEIKSAKSTESH
jgi:hypothetical protein